MYARKDCELSNKCKLNGLKYCSPQIYYIRILKFYLFQLTEIDNNGIVAVTIVAVFSSGVSNIGQMFDQCKNTFF